LGPKDYAQDVWSHALNHLFLGFGVNLTPEDKSESR